MSLVLDLDIFKEEEKKLKFGGKEFDLSVIPFEISLQFYELTPVFQKIDDKQKLEREDYGKIISAITDLLRVSDETIDKNWVSKRIDIKRFSPLITFIFQALYGDAKKNDQEVPAGEANPEKST
jgi:hypothetical protein